MSSVTSVSSSYRGSKRAACDRCREQKSRCPRQEVQDSTSSKCARCAKAGAMCVFSESLRASKRNSTSSKPPSERKDSQPSNLEVPWGIMAEVMAEEARDYALDVAHQEDFFAPSLGDDGFDIRMGGTVGDGMTELSDGQTMLTNNGSSVSKSLESYPPSASTAAFAGDAFDFLSQPNTSSAPLPGVEGSLRSLGNPQYPQGFEPFVNNYNWSLQHMLGVDTQALTYSPTNEVNHIQEPKKGSQTIPTPPKAGICETFRGMTGASGATQPQGVQKAAKSQSYIRSKKESGGSSDSLSTQAKSVRTRDEKASPSPPLMHDLPHRRMHELSELGMILYSQAAEITTEDESNPLELNMTNCLAVKVLESSVKFLDLLTSLYSSRTPSSCSWPRPSSSDDDLSTSEGSAFSGLNMAGRPQRRCREASNSSSAGNNSSCSQSCDSKANEDPKITPQPVDMTEVFSLLTCYIRILHLHSLLYSRLSDYLNLLSEKGYCPPPVFPGMQAGGVSFDNFGKFQVKFVVSVCTHVLGDIEMALGLPDGYRISKKDREHQGIFDESISVQFIEMAMKEKGKQGLRMVEKDRFSSIRNHLASLKQLLKGTIN